MLAAVVDVCVGGSGTALLRAVLSLLWVSDVSQIVSSVGRRLKLVRYISLAGERSRWTEGRVDTVITTEADTSFAGFNSASVVRMPRDCAFETSLYCVGTDLICGTSAESI